MSFPKYNPDGPDAWPDMWVPNKLQDLPSAVEAYFELASAFHALKAQLARSKKAKALERAELAISDRNEELAKAMARINDLMRTAEVNIRLVETLRQEVNAAHQGTNEARAARVQDAASVINLSAENDRLFGRLGRAQARIEELEGELKLVKAAPLVTRKFDLS